MATATSILVLDHDAASGKLCRELLEPETGEVIESADLPQALAHIAERRPDLIVVNGALMHREGLESVRRLKAEFATRDIPLLMLTLTEEDIAAALSAGADDYIIKPFQAREFVLRVRCLVHVYEAKAQLISGRDLLGEHARIMSVMLEFSRCLATTRSLDTVLDTTTHAAGQLLCCRRVSILLPDGQTKTLRIARSLGIDEDVAAALRIPMRNSRAGQVFLSGEDYIAHSVSEHNSQKHDGHILTRVPLLCVALNTGERVVGVLNVTERYGGQPFTPLELEYVSLLAGTAASVIDGLNSRKELDDSWDSLVVALAGLAEYRDNDTGKHLDRVTQYSLLLARELRTLERFRSIITDPFLADLARAVPLHDIGKVAVPDHILLKPGPLTGREVAAVQTHTVIGARTIRSVLECAAGAGFLGLAEQIARGHHEWYDGGGYPDGLSGDDIPLAARIVSVADVYDALATKRVYKDRVSHDEAVATISEFAGTQFDPDVVGAFRRRQEEFRRLALELRDEVEARGAASGVAVGSAAATLIPAGPLP